MYLRTLYFNCLKNDTHKSVLTFGPLLSSLIIILLGVLSFLNLNNVANTARALPLDEGPIMKDSNLKAEIVFEGLTSLPVLRS